MTLRMIVPVAVLLGFLGFLVRGAFAQESPPQYSRNLPMMARDTSAVAAVVTPLPTRRPPPPSGPGYCIPSGLGVPTPPNAVFGRLTIGGEPAPVDTVVMLTFNGKPGPGIYTFAAGGYQVKYAAGGQGHEPPCINEVGTELGILVNGVLVNSGILVGDPEFGLVLPFDVAIP